MKRFKFSGKILMILVLSLVFFSVSGQVGTSARAGGSSSHSSSSHSSSTHSSSSSGSSKNRSWFSILVESIIRFFFGLAAIFWVISEIHFRVKLGKKKRKCISAMYSLAEKNYKWKYENIEQDVNDAFYAIQNAWMERDQKLAEEYMSSKLYLKNHNKTEKMKAQNIKNMLEKVKLLKVIPVGLKEKDSEDFLWVCIKAKAIDYEISEKTGRLIEGSKTSKVKFKEFWRFVRKNDRWVADEIKQMSKIKSLDYFTIKVIGEITEEDKKRFQI